jgi:hypothetical protein
MYHLWHASQASEHAYQQVCLIQEEGVLRQGPARLGLVLRRTVHTHTYSQVHSLGEEQQCHAWCRQGSPYGHPVLALTAVVSTSTRAVHRCQQAALTHLSSHCTCVCMYVCMFVCLFVCLYVCVEVRSTHASEQSLYMNRLSTRTFELTTSKSMMSAPRLTDRHLQGTSRSHAARLLCIWGTWV